MAIVLAGAVVAAAELQTHPAAPVSVTAESDTMLESTDASDGLSATATAGATDAADASATPDVEVPDVTGRDIEVAESLLEVAGLHMITRVSDAPVAGVAAGTVTAQIPFAGAMVRKGSAVEVTYNAESVGGASQPIVVIDPGHQSKPDLSTEPIGPGSTQMKIKVAGGATGVSTHVPEYKRTLEISQKLRTKLEAAGVRVVMTRTSNDVNISNSQRAKIGNDNGANLVVRVHLDSANDSGARGISVLYPSGNVWCKPIEPESKRAAGIVLASAIKATGANGRGLSGRGDITGFNWSTVPTIIVEGGFMSNAAEDKLLATSSYQDKLAAGMAAGVLQYLGR